MTVDVIACAAYMSGTFGSWQLDSLIAVGGLGEVWRAHRGSDVAAVKRLHTHLARNDEALRQFSVEQDLTLHLPRHPNVVHGSDKGDVDGRPYIALELIPGEDLRRVVAPPVTKQDADPAKVTLARNRAVQIVAAACDAAAHLHVQGWVHGDICPGNLVIAPDRTVLIDLGVARAIGEAGAVRGTHAYMAPEQVRGEAWTTATDVFALGIVLWELIAGARLFHRGPTWLSMAAVVDDAAPPLRDAELDAIAQAALAKDPAQRIQTPAELAERLRILVES
jgi:serine/threonine-protein kinase